MGILGGYVLFTPVSIYNNYEADSIAATNRQREIKRS